MASLSSAATGQQKDDLSEQSRIFTGRATRKFYKIKYGAVWVVTMGINIFYVFLRLHIYSFKISKY